MTKNLYYYKLSGTMYYYREYSIKALRIEEEMIMIHHTGKLYYKGDPICKDEEIIQLYELYEKL